MFLPGWKFLESLLNLKTKKMNDVFVVLPYNFLGQSLILQVCDYQPDNFIYSVYEN